MNTVLLVLMMRILSKFSLENVLSFSIGTLEGEKNLFLTKWLLFLLYLHESKKAKKKIPFYQQLSAVLQFFRIKNCGPVLLMCCFYCEWRSVGVLFYEQCATFILSSSLFHSTGLTTLLQTHPHSQREDLWLSLDRPQQDTNSCEEVWGGIGHAGL